MMYLYGLVILFSLLLVDFITKYAAEIHLPNQVVVINDLLYFNYVQNYGAGFGILQNNQIFIIIVTFAALILFGYMLYRYRSDLVIFTCTILMVAGTIGNLYDRLNYGYVIDFIEVDLILGIWPTFNFADMYLVVGLIILIIYTFIFYKGNNE